MKETCFNCDESLKSEYWTLYPDGSKGGREWIYCSLNCLNSHLMLLDMLKKEETK